MIDQIPITAMLNTANLGSEIHWTLLWKTWFSRPNSVLNSHLHTMATAAGAATMGRKKMVR